MNWIKFIRIFLLVLIVIGIGLLTTQKIWVPKVVDMILKSENKQSVYVSDTQNKSASTGVSTHFLPTITLLSPTTNTILKEGESINIRWYIKNLPPDKNTWTVIGSVRCDSAECGKTGKDIFSYTLSQNPGEINWKIVPPADMTKFRGPNKNDYRNYGLNANNISSTILVCLVNNQETYAMGFTGGDGVYCSDELPVTILFDPPLSY
jgi:hypothetical protein